MANNLDSSKVNNYLNNAYSYGNHLANFKASHQFLQLGKLISGTATYCETWSEWIFGEVETLADDFVDVLKVACQYQSELSEGLELVGAGEAVPIEEVVCDVTNAASEAYNVIEILNEGMECSEVYYNLRHYDGYWRTSSNSDDTFYADVGAYAGKQYKYAKGCKALAKGLAETAFSSIASSLLNY